MSWRPSRWYPRVRPRTGPGGFGGRDCEREGPAGMTPARAVPRRAGRLAVAGGLALVVAVALYAFGRTHTPSYTMGLFGQHGVAVNRLKAQLATGMLGLALVQLTLALWMYRRLPGAGVAPPPVPVAGGVLVTLSVVMWYSSAMWYFDGSRLPLP